jgi:NADH dehydrogenase
VGDLASIAVKSGRARENEIIDAIGPEDYTFEQLVKRIARAVSRNIAFVRFPPRLGISLGKLIGLIIGDVLLTKDELDGLMSNLLTSDQQPNGKTKFSRWLETNEHTIGTSYASELDRHFRWGL